MISREFIEFPAKAKEQWKTVLVFRLNIGPDAIVTDPIRIRREIYQGYS